MWSATDEPNRYLLLALIAFLTLGGFTACTDNTLPDHVQMALEEVRKNYAPDKRVALWDLELHRSGNSLILKGETNMPEAKEELLNRLKEEGEEVADQARILPAAALNGLIRGVVNVSVANIRSTPKHSAELATQATLGTGLRVLKKEGDWYLVQTPDAYLGWMDRGGFALLDEKKYGDWIIAEKVIILADYSFALESPSAQAARVGDVIAGNILAKGLIRGDYQEVFFPDGRSAFVPLTEIMDWSVWLAEKEKGDVRENVNTALRYMGRPYLWGGTSGKGMDCSGFTKTVYFMNGMVLPRDASQQVNAGVEVPTDRTLKNLEIGDFIFFGQKAEGNQKEKIRHVAIYLGDGQIIHSGADNPGIKIESLYPESPNFAAHRLTTLVRVRRMDRGSAGVTSIRDLPDFFGPSSLID